jgi:leucyl aminopeptidase
MMNAKTAKRNERRDLERLAQAIARWERQGQEWAAEGDAEMARVHAKDAEDLRKVAEAVKDGEYELARARVQRLDTIVRDQVPCRLYNRLFNLD